MAGADDDQIVILAGAVDALSKLGPKARERMERIDGPYTPVLCGTCGAECSIGRHSQAMLEAGRASKVVCVACLSKAAARLTSEDGD